MDIRGFVCCDQFTASCANFLRRFPKAIGTGVENPEDLTPLRPFMASREIPIVLDNAESILDPQGAIAQENQYGYREAEQGLQCLPLYHFPHYHRPPRLLRVLKLSMEAAREVFWRMYQYGGKLDSASNIFEQPDFHIISVTLLATLEHQNMWNGNRLEREWERLRTDVIWTGYNESLACTVGLSLASPMFRELGPDARGRLEPMKMTSIGCFQPPPIEPPALTHSASSL
jgi:hypothetical protein